MEREQGGRVKVITRSKTFTAEGSAGVPPEGVVHLWSWLLPVEELTLSELEGTLSDDEWRRVRRLRSHSDARRFISRRGMMRQILGSYLELHAHELAFCYGGQGKPFLAPSQARSLSFNLSDSGELAVLAVCSGHPIGVDVERIRPCTEAAGIDAAAFAQSGIGQANARPPLVDADSFFRSWTRKEAVVKARGSGLQLLSGGMTPSQAAHALPPPPHSQLDDGPGPWRVYPLPLPPGYAGALAASQEIETIVCFPCAPDLAPVSGP